MATAELTEQTTAASRQALGSSLLALGEEAPSPNQEPRAKSQEPTFRVLGMNPRARPWKEKVVAEGLSEQEAEALAQRMRRDVLCRGFNVWTEEEAG